jgi:hypothetical protein
MIQQLIERFLARDQQSKDRAERRSERKAEALVFLAVSGRTIQAIAEERGYSADVLRQWMGEKQFRADLESLPEEFADFIERLLRQEIEGAVLGPFGSNLGGKEFLGPAAAVELAKKIEDATKQSSEKGQLSFGYWAGVQRLAMASLDGELDAAEVASKMSEGWVMRRGRNNRNDEVVEHFKLGGGSGNPMEWIESLARRELFDQLNERLKKEVSEKRKSEATWIIGELKLGDEWRAKRLQILRNRISDQKSRSRNRVARWRKANGA